MPVPASTVPAYENVTTAPMVYFDVVAAYGMMDGTIEIEVACRHLIPMPSGAVDVKLATSARIRCSPAAATALKKAIDGSLAMQKNPQQQPLAASGRLN